MPSAANIKVDKQITSETASVDSASNQQNTPIKQAIVVIEHKIRNLEKRKVKLESYRELQNSGKDLNQDQKVAVAKYDEVVQTLDFARDLCKQFQTIAAVADKESKKVARKEASARSQQEIAKVREILLVQDALTQLGQDNVRDDFLIGRNGAVTLTDSDLKLLDDIYPEVSPKHEPGAPANFTTNVQTAAEHLLAIVDGKPKEAFGSTYSYMKEVIGKIHESGYFDQPIAAENMILNAEQQQYAEELQEPLPVEPEIEEVTAAPQASMEASMPPVVLTMEGPIASMGYHVEATHIQEEITVVQAPAAAPVLAPVIEPQFYQPPTRPITEVLGTGAFFFLQDSELDSPEQAPQNPVMQPAAIPSQTFTNQNFVSMAEATGVPRPNPNMPGFVAPLNPPPPIPMPPSHLTGMEFPPQQQMANYAAYQQTQGQQPVPEQMPQQQPPPHHMHHGPTNGGSDDVSSKQPSGDSPKNGGRPRNNPNQRRNGPSGPNNYHQSYYQQQHNNGYSNRPRPARGGGSGGGPRSGGNRPPTQNHQNKPPKQQAAQHL